MVKLSRRQGQKGQAIAEGAGFLLILLPLMIAMLFLMLFIVINGYYHMVLVQIADAGARTASNDRYFLAAPTPWYKTADEASKVDTTIQNIWKTLKMPGTVTTTYDDASPDIVSVTVTATGLPIPSAGFLPAGLQLTAQAVEPFTIQRPIGVWGIGLQRSDGKGGMGITVPTYGAGAASGCYSPKTPGPGSGPNSSFAYWYTDLQAYASPPNPPINGPFSTETMDSPFVSY